jgi:parallel beta-helix repeat protein
MLKNVIISFLTLVFFTTAITPCINSNVIDYSQTTIYVDDDAAMSWYDQFHVKTISEALTKAFDGYNIEVFQGEYKENIVIDKMVEISGEVADLTIIDGDFKDHTVKITRDGAGIKRFTIMNSAADKAGIYINQNHYSKIILNKIIENGNGIQLLASNGNTITDNVIEDNSKEGIFLDSCHFNEIDGNNVNSNGNNGMKVDYTSTFNKISGNIAGVNSESGILINDASRSNSCVVNQIKENKYGLQGLQASDSNVFHHNDFKDNLLENAFDSSTNEWNSVTQKGNYWSNFDEASEGAYDNDGDGIVDSEYEIPGGENKDRYPLFSSVGPGTPNIDGPLKVEANKEAEFRFFTEDTKYDEVRFQIYWGDGEYFETPNPVVAAVGVVLSHLWEDPNPYNIRVRTITEIEGNKSYSEWARRPISVPKTYVDENYLPSSLTEKAIEIIKKYANTPVGKIIKAAYQNIISQILDFYNQFFDFSNDLKYSNYITIQTAIQSKFPFNEQLIKYLLTI